VADRLKPLEIVDAIAEEALRRIQASAAAKGGKLSANDRARTRSGAALGAALAFQMMAEAHAKETTPDGG